MDQEVRKLNIGCGHAPIWGYTNIDNWTDVWDDIRGKPDKERMMEIIGSFRSDVFREIGDDILSFYDEESKCISYEGKIDQGLIKIQTMDGNDMSFEDGSFDRILSNQCVGIYVVSYKEIARVLKVGGSVMLGVWGHKVMDVMLGLMEAGIRITGVELLNGWVTDDTRDMTLMIKGVKTDNGVYCFDWNEIDEVIQNDKSARNNR